MIKNILFDWSGTLYDDFSVSFISTRATIRHFGGPPITLKDYRKHFTLPVWKFYRRYLKKFSINEIDRFYFDHFTAHAPRGGLFSGAKAVLKTARQKGMRLFIFSTVRQSILLEICNHLGITPYFDAIVGSVRDKEKTLKKFLRTYRLNPKETLFIGDTEHDVIAAKKNGMKAGAMLCGYHSQERLLECAPDFVWNDHEGLRKSLGKPSFPRKRESRLFVVPQNLDSRFRGNDTCNERPISTVGALIFNKGDIFLIQTHKWSHTFGIPGGKIKKRETMFAALKREIREETGMKIKNIRFAIAQDSLNSKEFYRPRQHFLLLNFYADSPTRKFKLNDEAETGIWVSPQTALRLNLNQPTRLLIAAFLGR